MECPADGSLKSFFDRCLDALEEATDIIIPSRKSAKSVGDKERLFKKLALRWNLGMIVIEEIQQLSIKRVDTMNQFLTLSNDTLIPIVYVGTYKALDRIFGIDFRLARRLGNEIEVKRYSKDEMWEDMLSELWEFQWLKEFIPLTPELNEAFYGETAGIMDRVITLFEVIQLEAIYTGKETVKDITPQFIKMVSERYFSTTRKILHELSEGNTKNIGKWDDLYNRSNERELIRSLSSDLVQREAKEILLDNNRKKEHFIKNELRNRTVEKIQLTFGETYSVDDIVKAYDFVVKKNPSYLKENRENDINRKIIEILFDQKKMVDKKKGENVVESYELPILNDII